MTTEIRVPTLGESVSEATIGKWFKKVGDVVKADEPLVELETDKVTLEVNAPASGILAEIVAVDGTTVGVGALLGQIAAGGAAAAPKAYSEAKPDVAHGLPNMAATAPSSAPLSSMPQSSMPPAPAAAKIAADNNIAVSSVEGSGKRGQVLKGDVLAAIAAPMPAPAPVVPVAAPVVSAPRAAPAADDATREERVKMTKLRQTIARRLKEAQNTAAMLTTFNEVDMSEIMALRARYKDVFEKKHGSKLGFMGLFVKACVQALKELPAVNAEIDGADLVYKNYYHIGIAVDTPDGLVVPVIRDVDRKGIGEISRELGDLSAKARDGKLSASDMQGASFTISSLGGIGGTFFTPIVNAPEVAILGVVRSKMAPVWDGKEFKPRLMLPLCLSYDHRVIDGASGARFSRHLATTIEDVRRLVL